MADPILTDAKRNCVLQEVSIVFFSLMRLLGETILSYEVAFCSTTSEGYVCVSVEYLTSKDDKKRLLMDVCYSPYVEVTHVIYEELVQQDTLRYEPLRYFDTSSNGERYLFTVV